MTKQKLYIDMDNTLTNSTKSFCQSYNHLYEYKQNFNSAQWKKVNKYNFSDQCRLLKDQKDVLEIFESDIFFKKLEFINENACEILKQLNDKYLITIVTIGTLINLSKKTIWLKENLSFINNHIFINNGNCEMKKDLIRDGILIDDVSSNLHTSNAERKICFGKIFEWNSDWIGERCFDWDEVWKALG